MRSAFTLVFVLAAALSAAVPLRAPAEAAQPVTIYGIELQVSRRGERISVLADGPIAAEVLEQSPEFLMLSIRGAVLDASMRERLEPAAGGAVQLVTALQRGRTSRHEVRLLVDSAVGPDPVLSPPGRALTIDFAPADS